MLRSHAPSRIPGAALLAVLPFIALLLPACDFTPPDVTGGGGEGTPSDVACDDFVADSVSQFSGTQGQASWYYGYYHDPGAGHVFTPFTQFNNEIWTSGENVWTRLEIDQVHPNGTNGNLGRDTTEQWVVRRWVSHTAGRIAITGTIDRFHDNDFGNGVFGRILVDDAELWTRRVTSNSTTSFDVEVTAEVSMNSTVDFIVDPQGDDTSDGTVFTVSIQCAPASE